MKRILLLCLTAVFMVAFSDAWAQDRTITGKVTAASDGSVLPGVSVVLKGTTTGTVTDADGKYSLSVPGAGGILVFSFIGSKSEEIEIGSKSVVDVAMADEATQLNEVVITGSLGLQRQEKELGYAASTISTAELTRAKAVDVAQSLNGKISGVNITTTSGGVFSNARINIRGVRSLTGNNQPMLVVDGAQVPYNVLGIIPPDDIDDITILKSGSSAALYGPDAVNGVLVVTTKRGKNGATNANPTISLTSSYQATRVAYFPKLQHSFGAGAGEVVDQYGNYGYVPYENQIYGPRYDGTMQDLGVTLEDGTIQRVPYSTAHKKDKTKFWNTGSTFQNTVSLQGNDYYISFSDAQVKGLMPDDKNRRTAIRINGDKKFGKFSVNYSLGYSAQKFNVVNEAQLQNAFQGAYSGSIMFAVMQTPDNVPLLSYRNTKSGWGKFDNYFNEFAFNPYWVIQNLRSIGNNNNMLANATLSYQVKPWLKATTRFASATTDARVDNIQNPLNLSEWTLANRNATTYQNVKGSVTNSMQRQSLFNIDYFLDGKAKASNLSVSYVVGGNFRETYGKDVTMTGNNLVADLPNITIRSGDAVINGFNAGNNYKIRTRRVSAFGSVNFGFKDWAFVEITGRNDWDSRLAKNNRSLFYPGANASLVLSDAISSLKGSFISYLKLRGAYSKSGNVNLGPYSLRPTYSPPAGFPFGSNAGFSADGVYPSSDLKPETVITTEAGIELSVLNNKIDFNATYFNSACNNQILQTSLPVSTGYAAGLANAASFTNSGVELDLGLAKMQVGRGAFSFKVNATYNTNKVTATPNGDPVILTGTGNFIQISRGSPTANNIAQVGHPAFQFQLSDYKRDSVTGKVIVNSYTGNPSADDKLVVMGRSLPLWIFGFTPRYEIGGLTLSMTWDYKTGHNFYSGIGSDMDFSGISARSASYGRKRFVFPNSVYLDEGTGKYVDNKNIQIQDGNYGFWTGSSTNTSIATNYFASAAALRLREVNITYQIPQKWVSQTKYIKKISISLVGRNLLLIVPKSNQWGDPEYNYSSTGNTAGLSSAFLTPSGRLYGGSINFTL